MRRAEHPIESALDCRFTGLKPPMKFAERVFRQDARRTTGPIDFETPRSREIGRPLEGPGIQRPDVAVDPPRDDSMGR